MFGSGSVLGIRIHKAPEYGSGSATLSLWTVVGDVVDCPGHAAGCPHRARLLSRCQVGVLRQTEEEWLQGPPHTHSPARGGGDCRVLTTAESVVSVAGPHAIITACKQRLNMQICLHYYIIEVWIFFWSRVLVSFFIVWKAFKFLPVKNIH